MAQWSLQPLHHVPIQVIQVSCLEQVCTKFLAHCSRYVQYLLGDMSPVKQNISFGSAKPVCYEYLGENLLSLLGSSG
jgi:hypothetical protein